MKSLGTSTVLHAVLLSWGLWSFGTPEPLDMSSSEALPVSVVPMTEYSELVAGDREAPLAETPAPQPTTRPETLPMPAENVGDNEVDLDSAPRPETAPRETVQTATAAAPPPAPEPEPAPAEPVAETPPPEPEPPVEIAEPTPEPTPEPEPTQTAELAPEPAPEPAPSEPTPPQNVPVPQIRPAPPRPAPEPVREAEAPRPPETPRPPQRETPAEQTQTAEQSAADPEFDADEIAALLNREQSAGGGAQRSQEQAALGGTRTTGATLTQSELDALRGQIQRCWSPPSGVAEAGSLRISIQMRLDQSGALQGLPEIVSGSGASMMERVAGEAALRAIRLCAPYNLPIEKYETWSQVQINFDPSQMF